MQLIRIQLENWRGVAFAEIGLAAGVTIVEGANEAGKSSFIEALNLIFRERDSTRKQELKRVVPKGVDAGCSVEVELKTGAYHFTYRKTFIKKPTTTLFVHAPDAAQLTGMEAHERALEMLTETIDFSLWQAIQLEQGNDFTQVNLKSSNSLAQALDTAAGGTATGEGEAILLDKVRAEYLRYYTEKSARETGDLKLTREQLSALDEKVAEGAQLLATMESQIERSAQLASELRQTAATLPQLQTRLQDYQQQQSLHAAQQEQLTLAKSRLQTQQLRVDQLQHRQQTRKQLCEQVDKRQAALVADRQQLVDLDKTCVDAEADLLRATEDREKLLATRKQAESDLRRVESGLQLRDKLREAEQLKQVLLKISEAQRERDSVAEALGKLLVDDESIATIEALEQQRREQQVRINSHTPVLTIAALKNTELLVDGEVRALSTRQIYEADTSGNLEMQIGDIATIKLRAAEDVGELTNALATLESKLHSNLQQCSVGTVAEAVSVHRKRADLLERSRLIALRCSDLADGVTVESVKQKLAVVQQKTDQLRAQGETETNDPAPGNGANGQPADMPLANERIGQAGLEQLQLRFRNVLSDSDHALQAARRARDEAQTASANAATQLELARQRLSHSEASFNDLGEQLKQARMEIEDQRLVDCLQEELSRLEISRKTAVQTEASIDTAGGAQLDELADNARQVLDRARNEMHEQEKEQAAVRARLDQLQPEGLHEKLETLRAKQSDASARLAQLERAADAASRLWKTLCRHQLAAQLSYAQPLAAKVAQMGKLVFGADFAIQLNDSLTIESRTLNSATVPFEDLSGGAREQLGIMLRLAAAQLVSGAQSMPLILDDTLGHTDPDRLATMGALLNSAGRQAQIVVLTCYPQRYRHVGDATVVRLAATAAPPMSESVKISNPI